MGVSLLLFRTAAALNFQSIALALFLTIVAGVAWLLLCPVERWRLRKIPGPKPVPLFGNLLDIMRQGSPNMFLKWKGEFGPVFKVWFGRRAFVVVADADLIRIAAYRSANHAPMISFLRGQHRQVDESGLVGARDGLWRLVRNAWQPAFSSSSLAGYVGLMDDTAMKLVRRLKVQAGKQQEGREGAQGLDIWAELGNMTLQVVGTTAYGVDFEVLNEQDSEAGRGGSGQQRTRSMFGSSSGAQLVQACKDFFEVTSVMRGSRWGRVNVLLPELTAVIAWLANRFPDRPYVRQMNARRVILDVSTALISKWKDAHSQQQEGGDRGKAGRSRAEGVAPGSFLGLLLDARDKASGQTLSDLEIIAQAQTFILAGYETTANALAYAIYLISQHPEVEAKLLAEINSQLSQLPEGAVLSEEVLAKFEYTGAVLNEALRLYPPAHVTTRDIKEPLQLGDVTVPAGTDLLLSIRSVHRNPEVWGEDPDKFDPDRFLNGASYGYNFIPFGLGTRMCIGYKFALMEAKIALLRLYQHLAFELEPGQVPLQLAYGLTMSPKNGVYVRVKPRA